MKRVTRSVLALLCIGMFTVWNGSSRAEGPAGSSSAVTPDSLEPPPLAPDSILVVLTTGSELRNTTPRGLAFTGKPLPETRWFLITHAGVAVRLDAGSSLYERNSAYILADLGAMRNVGKRWAVGANVYVGADDYRSRVGPKARIRYWLGGGVAAEAAAGILVTGTDEWNGAAIFPGYVGEVNVGHNETFLLTAAVETIDIEKSGTSERDTSWYLGVKTGGVPGAILTLAGLVALGIILSVDTPSLW